MELVHVCATLDSIKAGHSWLCQRDMCFKCLLCHLSSCLRLGPLRCSTSNCQWTKSQMPPKATGCLTAWFSCSLYQLVWFFGVYRHHLTKARWVPGAYPKFLRKANSFRHIQSMMRTPHTRLVMPQRTEHLILEEGYRPGSDLSEKPKGNLRTQELQGVPRVIQGSMMLSLYAYYHELYLPTSGHFWNGLDLPSLGKKV